MSGTAAYTAVEKVKFDHVELHLTNIALKRESETQRDSQKHWAAIAAS